MTREETQKLLMTVQSLYPNYRVPDKTVAINAWQRILEPYPYSDCMAGVEAYARLDDRGFPPSVGQIIAQMHRSEEINASEAWALVSKAIRNSAYAYVEEFGKLPPDVQRAVGSAMQLHYLATSEDYNEEVEKSLFVKSYREILAEKRIRERLAARPDRAAGIGSGGVPWLPEAEYGKD